MEAFWQELSTTVLSFAALAALAGAAAAAIYYTWPGVRRSFWPLRRVRHGDWSGAEVFLAFAMFGLCLPMVESLLAQMRFFEAVGVGDEGNRTRRLLYAYPLYFFLAVASVIALLFVVSRSRPRDYGLTWARWPQCVVQGLAGFILISPLVLGLYFLLALVLPIVPHGLETLKDDLWLDEFWLVLFQACIAAPVMEEMLFRGVLQGWLRRASPVGHATVCIGTLVFAAGPLLEGKEVDAGWQALGFASLLVGLYAWRFAVVWRGLLSEGPRYLLAATPNDDGPSPDGGHDAAQSETAKESSDAARPIDPERWSAFQAGNLRLSILGSAMFFAAGHSMVWPSPIPLFFLGLGLGWLALRTQSLVGPIVLHAFFNAVAFGVLLQSSAAMNGSDATAAARPCEGGKTFTAAPASQ